MPCNEFYEGAKQNADDELVEHMKNFFNKLCDSQIDLNESLGKTNGKKIDTFNLIENSGNEEVKI